MRLFSVVQSVFTWLALLDKLFTSSCFSLTDKNWTRMLKCSNVRFCRKFNGCIRQGQSSSTFPILCVSLAFQSNETASYNEFIFGGRLWHLKKLLMRLADERHGLNFAHLLQCHGIIQWVLPLVMLTLRTNSWCKPLYLHLRDLIHSKTLYLNSSPCFWWVPIAFGHFTDMVRRSLIEWILSELDLHRHLKLDAQSDSFWEGHCFILLSKKFAIFLFQFPTIPPFMPRRVQLALWALISRGNLQHWLSAFGSGRCKAGNELQNELRRLDRSVQHNEVRQDKSRWFVVCSASEIQDDGSRKMKGHTTTYKCEQCDVSLCHKSVYPFFRTYHTAEVLYHTPRSSRSYSARSSSFYNSRCVSPTPGNSSVNHRNSSIEHTPWCSADQGVDPTLSGPLSLEDCSRDGIDDQE